MSELSQEETNKIMAGMEEVNRKMVDDMYKNAPMCHMRKMFLDESDTTDGHSEMWWECSVCGHTKAA